jgi:hypothetical protein
MLRVLLDPGQRVGVAPVDTLSTPEDPVQLDQELVLGAVRQTIERGPPSLDLFDRDRLKLTLTERGSRCAFSAER